jgi:hypothetical protein
VAFIELLPADEWERMIKAEAQAFFEPRKKKDTYGRDQGVIPSAFSELAKEVLTDIMKTDPAFKNTIREELVREVGAMIDSRLPDLVKELAMTTVREAVKRVSQDFAYSLSNSITQNI